MCLSESGETETEQPLVSSTSTDLPDPASWPHRPILVLPARGTRVPTHVNNAPLPIGEPVEFESDIFKGKMLIRLRSALDKSDNPTGDRAYFEGRKRVMQFIVQGQFKEPLQMSEVYTGNKYERPLKRVPPKQIDKIFRGLMRRIAPGLILDLSSQKPQVMTLQASSAMAFSIDKPGEEPDISALTIEENTEALGKTFKSSTARQKYLAKNAAKYSYDTEHVYTFDNYQDIIDYGTYHVRLPFFMNVDLAATMNGQPMSYTAMTKDGRFLYDFPVWHERLLANMPTNGC